MANILGLLNANLLSREQASGLYAAADRIAKTLKIETPNFYVIPEIPHQSQMLNMFSSLPNAASISRKDIAISQPMFRLFDSVDLTKPISKELEGFIAHEMHHCAHRTSAIAMSRGPVLAVPAIALTALYLYDRAHAKAKDEGDESKENITKHINAAAIQEAQKAEALKGLVNFAKYAAVTVVAGAGGLWLARHGSRYHEFAADGFGASVVGKEVMANALTKIHAAAKEAVKRFPAPEGIQKMIMQVVRATVMAHPTVAERTSNILR